MISVSHHGSHAEALCVTLSRLAYSGAVFTHSYDRAQSKTPKAFYCDILSTLNHRGSKTSEEAGRFLVGHTRLPCFITSQKNCLTFFSLKGLKASHKRNASCPQRTQRALRSLEAPDLAEHPALSCLHMVYYHPLAHLPLRNASLLW